MDPVTILATIGSVLASTGRLAVQISELVQTPEEVEAALSEITKCERKLGELINLRKKHATLLAQRPDDEQRIENTIQETWEALGRAMPLLERNKVELSSRRSKQTSPPPSSKNPVAGLGKRVRWIFQDEGMYRNHEKAICGTRLKCATRSAVLSKLCDSGPWRRLLSKRGSKRDVGRKRSTRIERKETRNRWGVSIRSLSRSRLQSLSSTGSLANSQTL